MFINRWIEITQSEQQTERVKKMSSVWEPVGQYQILEGMSSESQNEEKKIK